MYDQIVSVDLFKITDLNFQWFLSPSYLSATPQKGCSPLITLQQRQFLQLEDMAVLETLCMCNPGVLQTRYVATSAATPSMFITNTNKHIEQHETADQN